MSSISKDIDRGSDFSSAPVARAATKALDAAVRESIRGLLLDKLRLSEMFDHGDTATMCQRLATAAELALQVGPHSGSGTRSLLERLRFSITVHAGGVDASISRAALLATLDHQQHSPDNHGEPLPVTIDTNVAWRKRGARLVIAAMAPSQQSTDPALLALLTKSHRARETIFEGTQHRDRHLERLARLAYLAPDITSAILDGTQPKTLTSRKLLKLAGLPLDWADQRKLLGFA